MMKGAVFIGSMAILIVAAIAAVVYVAETTDNQPAMVNITSVATDRSEYHSRENMEILVTVSASKPGTGYTIKVEGILDKRGNLRIAEERTINMTAGENEVLFNYQLPSCNRCSGIPAGDYDINVSIMQNQTILSHMTHSISLQQ